VIVNALEAVCPSASVAVIVKLLVVVSVDPVSVPVIVAEPTPVFKVAPPGNVPDVLAKLTASVAVKVKLKVPPFATVPREPDPVTHAGASDIVKSAVAVRAAKPSLFSNLIKYVPSTATVKLATTVVVFVNVTLSATTMAPVEEFCASTAGGDELSLKFVPVSVILDLQILL
jgi:hypothetical protein